jgi:DNA ligase (NAD+)
MPGNCPSCGSHVVREGAYVLCPAGLACPAQRIGRIIHYASRDALDIETLGEKSVEQLVENGLVERLPDLYRLEKEQLASLDGFAEKSAARLHRAIQGSRKPPLERFLYALGIRHVGGHVAQVLARRFGSLEKLKNSGRDELERIDEIGPETADSVCNFFLEEENRDILEELGDLGVRPKTVKPRKSGGSEGKTLEGLTFVFTGELSGYTRREAGERVESLGGRSTSSLSGNTDYLVVGEKPGGKLEEARRLEVKILNEEQFERLLEEKT